MRRIYQCNGLGRICRLLDCISCEFQAARAASISHIFSDLWSAAVPAWSQAREHLLDMIIPQETLVFWWMSKAKHVASGRVVCFWANHHQNFDIPPTSSGFTRSWPLMDRLSALGNASRASHCHPVQTDSQAQLRCSSGSTSFRTSLETPTEAGDTKDRTWKKWEWTSKWSPATPTPKEKHVGSVQNVSGNSTLHIKGAFSRLRTGIGFRFSWSRHMSRLRDWLLQSRPRARLEA